MKPITQYSFLVCELTINSIKTRYHSLGRALFWGIVSPLVNVGIFYLVFKIIFRVHIPESSFVVYLMTSAYSWRLFSESVIASTTSLLDNKNLIRESPFPHILVPLAIVAGQFIILSPGWVIIIVSEIISSSTVPHGLWILPGVMILHGAFTLALSVICSLAYVRFRDLKHLLELILNLLFYLTPCFYSLYFVKQAFPAWGYNIYIHNPLVGFLNLYRFACLSGIRPHLNDLAGGLALWGMPVLATLLFSLISVGYYKKVKHKINDYLAY